MEEQTRKRRVGIVTPPNVRKLNNCTPSPKSKRAKPTYSSPTINSRSWDEEDVFEFLEENGHEDTGRILKDNKVTGKSLPSLTDASLREMGISDKERSEVLLLFASLQPFSMNSLSVDFNGCSNSKVFNDPIHGHIEIHPLCVKIIDTPQFQRLRNIKQLGACYFVFPGASHNRFEHSIGTGHLAYRLGKSIKKRQPGLEITEKDLLCVRIAGLCHDLGHGPFSHMFDTMFIPEARKDYDWKHETSSVRMFDYLIEANNLQEDFAEYGLDETDLTFIKELIIGPGVDRGPDKNWPYKGRTAEKSFLYEIVANKRTGIDVDKWDYFARDCHCLGLKNNFDHKRFMKFARVIRVEGKLQICLRDKEANNVYDMFHTRVSLFRRAYQHKTSNIIEAMITEALLKADSHLLFKGKNGRMLKISETIDDMVAYSQLTDHVYYQILCSTDPNLAEAREIIQRIEKRQLYKCFGQTILKTPRDEDEIPDIIKEICRSAPPGYPKLDAKDIIVHLIRFDYGMKDRNPIDEVRFYSKENPNSAMKYRKDQVSFMLPEYFTEQEMRVYCRKRDTETLKIATKCFEQWCLGRECTTPKGGHMNVDLTPMKSSQDDNQHGQSCRNMLDFKDAE